MKLLFICDIIDLQLKQRLEELTRADIEVHCLVLSESALYKNSEKEIIDTDNSNLQIIFKNLKYKKLFDALEKYDGVNVYKCSTICAPYLDNIKKISKRYFITADEQLCDKNRHIIKLFDKSSCILFENEEALLEFENHFGYDEKTLIDRDSIHLFVSIDNVDKSEIKKFLKFLNINSEKNLVYCDLGSNLATQIAFIDDLLKLPMEQLRNCTFVLDPSSLSIVDKESLIEQLDEKRFDYLLPDSLLTDSQKAMLIVSCHSCIILPDSKVSNTLSASLYAKNHVYNYKNVLKNSLLKDHGIFIDTFDNFANLLTFNADSHHLLDELLEKNKTAITKLFHPKVCLKNYLEVLKIL